MSRKAQASKWNRKFFPTAWEHEFQEGTFMFHRTFAAFGSALFSYFTLGFITEGFKPTVRFLPFAVPLALFGGFLVAGFYWLILRHRAK